VLGRFAGVRPLLKGSPHEPSARSREWRLLNGPTELLSAVGGKWTTYRRMAESITDEVMKRLARRGRCRTRSMPLGAPHGDWGAFESSMVTLLRQRHALSAESARHLVRRYGKRVWDVAHLLTPQLARPVVEGEPDLLVEFVYQRQREMAVKAEDCLLRRTRLGLFYPALLASPERVMGELK
jgi:glycerol-3-phosphate dehydrogenase